MYVIVLLEDIIVVGEILFWIFIKFYYDFVIFFLDVIIWIEEIELVIKKILFFLFMFVF